MHPGVDFSALLRANPGPTVNEICTAGVSEPYATVLKYGMGYVYAYCHRVEESSREVVIIPRRPTSLQMSIYMAIYMRD
jgi:hypothetical protein